MSTDRHLTWPNFQSAFLAAGAPAIHPVPGEPKVELFVDSTGARIGLRTPLVGSGAPIDPGLAAVLVTQVLLAGNRYLEVSTRERPLYQSFFHLLMELADAIQLTRLDPVAAVDDVLKAWRDLLQDSGRLPREAQVGLFGELWVLDRLARSLGPQAVFAWTGPYREPHDFRLLNADLEVKTTSAHSRKHSFNGFLQLAPVSGRPLWIVSLQVERAGLTGGTLPDSVTGIFSRIKSEPTAKRRFSEALERSGYFEDQAFEYPDRFALRGPTRLVHVEDSLPRITLPLVQQAWPQAWQRFGEVRYELNLEGLGVADGSDAFLSLLP